MLLATGSLHDTAVHPGMAVVRHPPSTPRSSASPDCWACCAGLGGCALAFDIKRIPPWRTPFGLIIAVLDFLGVGVVQWLSIRLHAKPLTDYFSHLMYRQYISDTLVWGGGRPQFLFADPAISACTCSASARSCRLVRGRAARIYAKRLRDLSSSRMPSARCSCRPAPGSSSIPWRC